MSRSELATGRVRVAAATGPDWRRVRRRRGRAKEMPHNAEPNRQISNTRWWFRWDSEGFRPPRRAGKRTLQQSGPDWHYARSARLEE